MLLGVFTVLIMGIVAYAFWREGPLTAFAACVNVLLAGVVAFNFWEPIADALDPALSDSFAEGIEDALALMLIFLPVLMLLRWITNSLASTHMEYPSALYRGGAVVGGLLAGYLAAGFLTCVIQTLPLPREFLLFEPYEPGKSSPARKVLPADLVWLSMMHRLSAAGLSGGDDRFDNRANFELRYARYRRYDEKTGKAEQWHGEMEAK
jgi:hypothetical protein